MKENIKIEQDPEEILGKGNLRLDIERNLGSLLNYITKQYK